MLLDGAHNSAGAAALRDYLDGTHNLQNIPITLVFGAMADKQLAEMAKTLFPIASRLIITEPHNPRASNVETLRQLAEKYAPEVSAEVTASSDVAMLRALSFTGPQPVICVTGSLYLVGEVRQWLDEHFGPTGRFS